MDKIKSYKDLQVWQKGIGIVDLVYEVTLKFPQEERYGLTSQMQRAAVSIPANIAEGYGRHTNKELIRFCCIALGSCSELETHLVIAGRRKYVADNFITKIEKELDSESKMIMNLIKSLRRSGD